MATSLAKMVITILKRNPNISFTAKELATKLWTDYKEEFLQKRNNPRFHTDEDIINQIRAEIGSQKNTLLKDSNVVIQDQARPKLYRYETNIIEVTEQQIATQDETVISEITEKDLYPLLSEYLLNECGIYSKRIDEQKSKNNRGPNGNMWLHPDIVGVELLDKNWNPLIKGCVQGSGSNKLKLYSYEVKMKLNMTNLRESFFQAVSNSSWANQGYLVAFELKGDVFEELKMLSSLHGIGFILLDKDNPTESQILLQANEKENVDWESANRLLEQNSDFYDFIQSVKVYYDSGVINKNDWWKK
jgi:hypothetical protein